MTSIQEPRAKVSRRSAIVRSLTVAVAVLGWFGQAQAATVTRTGTVKISGAIALVGVPATAALSCGVSINTHDQATGHGQSVSGSATCTRTGNRATIALSLPYTFLIDSKALKSATLSISVGASANAFSPAYRASTSTGYAVKVPASGATVPVSVKLAL